MPTLIATYSRRVSHRPDKDTHLIPLVERTIAATDECLAASESKDTEMLVLSRRITQQIRIGQGIVVTVLAVQGGQVRIGIDAPVT